ncbi:hypothetical protein DFH11DRAFT_1176088 [Phellopilus nigrolimitatus]|nr:hypothetical protein DFH11DRAFT_1176088 [Phellopilus nigrolimitatus]
MAQAFGRRPVMCSLLCFSFPWAAPCAEPPAPSDVVLVAGRAVQRAGLFSMADVVPLDERGARSMGYYGVVRRGLTACDPVRVITSFSFSFAIFKRTWCFAAEIGPAVGGALAQSGAWRWLFYLNLPITGMTAVLVVAISCVLKTPEGDFGEKIKRIDMIGTFLVMSSTCSLAIALTWCGAVFPWSSPLRASLFPLVFGALGLVGFLFYEALLAEFPLLPVRL